LWTSINPGGPCNTGSRSGVITVGFWHPGLHGVYDPKSLVMPRLVPTPVLYTCEVCNRNFRALEELRRHRFEQHPVRLPALLIRGRPVGGTPLKIQSPLSPAEVVIEDCSRCWVDERLIDVDSLRLLLADATTAFHVIRLSNDGAQTKATLDFQVAREHDLAGVERALARLASRRTLNLDAVGHFISECREYETGISYCDGISHYLFGVMAKEQLPGSGLARESYPSRYAQAVDQLTDIDRPMARSVRALVAFHFNHFLDAESLAPPGALRSTAEAFADLLDGKPWHNGDGFEVGAEAAVEDLFTDQVTLEILEDSSKGLASLTLMKDSLLSSLGRMTSGYDKTKRLLLTAEVLSYQDKPEAREDARRLLRQLASQGFVRAWSEAVTTRLRNK
jgi:hypothetical protein